MFQYARALWPPIKVHRRGVRANTVVGTAGGAHIYRETFGLGADELCRYESHQQGKRYRALIWALRRHILRVEKDFGE